MSYVLPGAGVLVGMLLGLLVLHFTVGDGAWNRRKRREDRAARRSIERMGGVRGENGGWEFP